MAAITDAKADLYLDEPPAYDFKELNPAVHKDLIADLRSINSTSTDLTPVTGTEFIPSKTLLLNARGIRLIRLPIPSGELEIPITNTNGDIVYLSTRAKRCSGDAVLHDASGKQLLVSKHYFGPGRDPNIRLLDKGAGDEAVVVTRSKWTSRRQEFVLPDGKIFTWRYVREVDAFASTQGKEKRRTHLVLELTDASATANEKSAKGTERGKRIAELVRNDEARTPKTRPSDAGNGGELKIDAAFCESVGIREDVVVASCLIMLKKEIDRRRAVQFIILASIAGAS
jgi:hypothetical protein